MDAFHNDPEIKQKYLARVRAHREADRLIQGTGWEQGRGCAVGCTLEAYDHARYPVELGLPTWLAYLEDRIFEGLPADQAMAWPARFLEAIPVGADVEPVRHRLAMLRMDRLIALQTIVLESAGEEYGLRAVIAQTIDALGVVRSCHEAEAGQNVCDWSAAWSAAESARSAAWSAAWSAAESAAWSAAWSAARSAARSAAESAESAAESAAWSAESAESAAESVFSQEADDLIRLLSDA